MYRTLGDWEPCGKNSGASWAKWLPVNECAFRAVTF